MITINVTEEDIKKGEKSCMSGCPVAIAARRATGRKVRVSINYLFYEFGLREHALPHEVSNFVCDFDNGLPVQPITFEIDL